MVTLASSHACGKLKEDYRLVAAAEAAANSSFNHSNAEAKHKDANIFENHLNPVMLVFIRKLSLSTLR